MPFVDFDDVDDPKKPGKPEPEEDDDEKPEPTGDGVPAGFKVLRSGGGNMPPFLQALLGGGGAPPEGAIKTKSGGYITEEKVKEMLDIFRPYWPDVEDKPRAVDFFLNSAQGSAQHDANCSNKECPGHLPGPVTYANPRHFRHYLNLWLKDDFTLFDCSRDAGPEYERLWAIKDSGIEDDPRFRIYKGIYDAHLLAHSVKRTALPELPKV